MSDATGTDGDRTVTPIRSHRAAEGDDDAPWSGIEVPSGYTLSARGVFQEPTSDKAPRTKLAGPVWVTGRTRDGARQNWGLLLAWLDSDGQRHEQAIAMARLHETRGTLVPDLAAQGLVVVPGKERALMTYLAAFDPPARVRSVDQLGWLDDARASLTYVLPTHVIGAQEDEPCHFQPERHSPSAETIRAAGTLEGWQTGVAMRAVDNPFLVFAVSAAFAGPLLNPARMEAGGFHLYGRSSQGKTTAAQVAASVWGCAADPAEAPTGAYVRRWNTTANALEGLAAAHNDGLLVLDEMGTCGGRDFGRIVYDLMGGQGKAAMNSDRDLKRARSWCCLVLSTGEISVAQRINEEGGKQARAGQLVRFMDIPIGDGILTAPSDAETAKQYAQALKRACADHYGTAGPAFLDALTREFPTHPALSEATRDRFQQARQRLDVAGLPAEAARAMDRLAIVQVAGEWAADLTVLPLSRDEVRAAVQSVRQAWLREGGHITEGQRGTLAIRDFLLQHPGRFGDAHDRNGPPVRDRAGYVDRANQLYLFTSAAFREACQGMDPREVAQALDRLGWLVTNEPKRGTVRRQVPAEGDQRIRFYAVRMAILEADEGGAD